MTEDEQQKVFQEFVRLDEHMRDICKTAVTMTRTPAWELVLALVKQRVLEVGDAALNDQSSTVPRPPGYWIGFRDGARGLETIVDQLKSAALALEQAEQLDFSSKFRLGGGEPSTGGGEF